MPNARTPVPLGLLLRNRGKRQTVAAVSLNLLQSPFQARHLELKLLQCLCLLREFLNLCVLVPGRACECLDLSLLLLDSVQHRPQNRVVVDEEVAAAIGAYGLRNHLLHVLGYEAHVLLSVPNPHGVALSIAIANRGKLQNCIKAGAVRPGNCFESAIGEDAPGSAAGLIGATVHGQRIVGCGRADAHLPAWGYQHGRGGIAVGAEKDVAARRAHERVSPVTHHRVVGAIIESTAAEANPGKGIEPATWIADKNVRTMACYVQVRGRSVGPDSHIGRRCPVRARQRTAEDDRIAVLCPSESADGCGVRQTADQSTGLKPQGRVIAARAVTRVCGKADGGVVETPGAGKKRRFADGDVLKPFGVGAQSAVTHGGVVAPRAVGKQRAEADSGVIEAGRVGLERFVAESSVAVAIRVSSECEIPGGGVLVARAVRKECFEAGGGVVSDSRSREIPGVNPNERVFRRSRALLLLFYRFELCPIDVFTKGRLKAGASELV